MKRLGQIFIIASAAVLLFWALPWLVNLITVKPYGTPFTLYSCTVHDFTMLDKSEGHAFRFLDTKGNVYGDEAQPMFYASILASRGELPDTIEGRPITLAEIERNAVIISSDPQDVNRPAAPVYLLMESVPERLELKDPEDAMVSRKNSIDIYCMDENRLLEDKTAQLNDALKEQGFAYPAKVFAGNPSDRKDHDEGYLVADSEDKIYQIKQVNGTMEVRHLQQADGLHTKWMLITEFENRATLGWLVSAENRLSILREDGSVVPTEVIFDPGSEDMLAVGDLFYYTIKTSTEEGEHFYALRSDDFSLVDTMDRPYPKEWSIPGISFTSGTDASVRPRL